jgi:hypothetical protein
VFHGSGNPFENGLLENPSKTFWWPLPGNKRAGQWPRCLIAKQTKPHQIKKAI